MYTAVVKLLLCQKSEELVFDIGHPHLIQSPTANVTACTPKFTAGPFRYMVFSNDMVVHM